ncbi:MAG: hypothetical protein IKF11_01080 [Methanobrevibacter sp.]|nr:hypothetical protein [Methanobrevibacter sp.]
MNKKLIMVLMAIAILLIMSVAVYAIPFFGPEILTVGNCSFDMPDGYSLNGTNKYCATAISNGTNTIYLLEQNSTDVNKYIKEYENSIKEKNESMKIQNLTIDGMKIYKTDNKDNPNTVHYWFVKGNHTYDIYKWDANKKMDTTVMNLINSIH